jgi:PAS domain S-box-containing protein
VTPDITERKRMEESLRNSEIWMRAVLDTALGAIVGMDTSGRITTWNARAEAVFGWTKDEALGLALTDTIIPEQHREAHRSGLARFLATGEERILNRRIEITARRRNGEEFPVELAITPLKIDDTRHFVAFIADITEREKAQSLVRETKDRMLAIINASMDAIISVDEDERIVVFNIAAEKLFQLPAAEALGQPIDRFIPARFRSGHHAHLRNFSQRGVTMREMGQFARLSALRADGREFPIEASISHARTGGKDLVTVTIRDITERRQAEAAQASF